jgi:hypothetical protein
VRSAARVRGAFSGAEGIYKCLRLCDSLRVKFHDQSPYFGCDCRFTQRLPGVEKAGQPCFFNARNSAAHRDRNGDHVANQLPVMAGVQVMALKETRRTGQKSRSHPRP